MENALVTYETAKLLKNKGFLEFDVYWYENTEETKHTEIRMGNFITIRNKIELCQIEYPGEEGLSDYIKFEKDENSNIVTYQNGFYFAPTQALTQKWLREVHNIEVLVYCNASGWMWELNKAMNLNSFAGGTHISWSKETGPNDSGEWDRYELALEAGIQEALKLI